MQLIQSTQDEKWPLGTWGVIGLAPKGDFFNYLLNVYDETPEIAIALKHTVIDNDVSSEDLSFKVQSYMNPIASQHYQPKNIIGEYIINTDLVNNWYLKGSISLENSDFVYSDQKLCLDSFTNDLFGIIDGEIWCQQVRKQVCGTINAKDCPLLKADLSKAPKITLVLENITISFSEKDYVYFNSEGLQCRIGDPSTARLHETCSQDTEVVLGKLFFAKYTPILKIDRVKGITKIILTDYFEAPSDKKYIWMKIGITIGIIVVLGIVYLYCKQKKGKSESSYYVKA